jgi:tetratricopeptide (TPR) repeat protein
LGFFEVMVMPATRLARIAGIFSLVLPLIALFATQLCAQTVDKGTTAAVEGTVQDSENHVVPNVVILLQGVSSSHTWTATADAQGKFRFEALPMGNYTLRAKLAGYQDCTQGPFLLGAKETKSVVLLLAKAASSKDVSNEMAFSDEPAFTVAGVTDTTALGGHGSGPIVRNSNVLSKETASLAHESDAAANGSPRDPATEEAGIREKLAREDEADLHVQLADVEEREGRPLDAVREYQRAAEMQPTEPHLFAWGAELLLHHAPEPAIEVFSKGHRLYPQSSRMMLGLGAAFYAQRSREQAEQLFLQACDLNPADPTPYMFLGRLQVTEQVVPAEWTERMKRFAQLHPENTMAHYLYGVALMKQSGGKSQLDVAEAELKTAIKLDAHLGDAYLELGILCSEREDFPAALAALQKAVENTRVPDEAHYRLAQVYRRMGEAQKAREESAEFKQLSEQKNEQTERERHEIPQFVYTLREQSPASQAAPSAPH